MTTVIYWLFVIGLSVGLWRWTLRQGPAIARAVTGLADTYAPATDWSAWAALAVIAILIFNF